MLRTPLAAAALAAAITAAGSARAGEGATEPQVRPTAIWAALQLLPSPEILVLGRTVHFGMRWQVTPLLYSFNINRRLSPWRSLIVEPVIRHAGSIELFASPEFLTLGRSFEQSWLIRGGLRAYFPIVEKGEVLSWSVGSSAFYTQERGGVSYELGMYTWNGIAGIQVTYTPTAFLRSTIITFALRYL